MNNLLSIILLLSLGLLIFLQTNRSIYMRSMGLLLIFACSCLLYIGATPGRYFLLFYLCCLMVIGFCSDYFSPSLRTWYFRVSYQSQMGVVIGGFVGLLLLFPWLPYGSLLGFFLFSIIGSLIGEIRANGFRTFKLISKATLGACAGIFGMSLKLLLGIEMICWILPDLSKY